jgi:hypothetical protein
MVRRTGRRGLPETGGPWPRRPRRSEGGTAAHKMAVAQFEEDLVRRFVEALEAQRRLLTDALRQSWGDVEEANFVASATSLQLKAQSDNEERIDFVMAYAGVAAGNGGLVRLGDADLSHTFVVPGGTLLATQCKIRLKNTSLRRIDTVVLTNNSPGLPPAGPAGFLYLGLFGSEVPIGSIKW